MRGVRHEIYPLVSLFVGTSDKHEICYLWYLEEVLMDREGTFIGGFIVFFILFLIGGILDAQPHIQVGGSWSEDNPNSNTGAGIGYRIGAGYGINDRVGLELLFEQPQENSEYELPALRCYSGFNCTADRNVYLSLLGTFRQPVGENWSIIAKAGIGQYELSYGFYPEERPREVSMFKERGEMMVGSVGLLCGFRERMDLELSTTTYFRPINSVSLNFSIRFKL